MTAWNKGNPTEQGLYEVQTEYPQRAFAVWDGLGWKDASWVWGEADSINRVKANALEYAKIEGYSGCIISCWRTCNG